LLAFPLYFYEIYTLSFYLGEKKQQYIFITSLTTISFVLEYFAYSRDYGMGMAFYIWFSYLLKMGGALYYGSLDGLWEVTGKSLSSNVLFCSPEVVCYILSLILILMLTYLFYAIKINGFWKQLKEKESIVSYYLFGNLIAIVLLANFLLVNYPEDKVGMYLILLFIKKRPLTRSILLSKQIKTIRSTNERINLITLNKNQELSKKKILLLIEGELKIDSSLNCIRIDFESLKNGKKTIFESLNQRWLVGEKKLKFSMKTNHLLRDKIEGNEKISIYIWNPQQRLITFKNGKTKVYELNQKNGIR